MNVSPELFDQLREVARSKSTALALANGDLELSFGELFDIATRVSTWLRLWGISSEDRVMIDLSNDYSIIVSLALMQLGCTSADIQQQEIFHRDGYTKLISSSRPEWLSDSQVVVVDNSLPAKLAFTEPMVAVTPFMRGTPVRILYSSGTTGLPKGVMFSQEVLSYRISAAQRNWIPAQPFLCMLSFSAGSGYIACLAQLLSGNPYLVPGFAPGNLRAIQNHKVKSVKGSPIQLRRLLEYCDQSGQTLSTLETVQSAGSFLSRPVAENLRDSFGARVVNLYGATEIGTVARADYFSLSEGEVGDLVPEVELVTPTAVSDSQGQASQPLAFKGPGLASGYAHLDPLTQSGLQGETFVPGDLGFLSPSGRLFVSGRGSDVINISGVKLNGPALSRRIQAIPGIVEAYVREGRSSDGEPILSITASPIGTQLAEQIQESLLTLLPPGVDFEINLVEEIKLTKSGKIST